MNKRRKPFPVFMMLNIIIWGFLCFSAEAAAEKLIIPSGVTVIESEAFYGDTSLEEVVLPEGITRIGERAFAGTSLTSVVLPDHIQYIARNAFGDDDQVTVHVRAGTETSRACARAGLPCLVPTQLSSDFDYELTDDGIVITGYHGTEKEIVIPGTLDDGTPIVRIRSGAFASKDITSIILRAPMTAVESYAFSNCTQLQTVFLPERLTLLGSSAFFGCTGITEISVPIDSNYAGAFSGCSSIRTIHYLSGQSGVMPDYDNNSYRNTLEYNLRATLETVTFESGVTHIGSYVFHPVNPQAGAGSDNRGILKSVSFPSTLRSIGECAFYQCNHLRLVVLPDGLESVGSYAFATASGKTVYAPSSLVNIGSGAFDSLTSLITPPGSYAAQWFIALDYTPNTGNPYVTDDQYTPLTGVRLEAQQLVINRMQTIEGPDAWPSLVVTEGGMTWQESVIYAVDQAVFNQELPGAIAEEIRHQQYLFTTIIDFMPGDPTVFLLPTPSKIKAAMNKQITDNAALNTAKTLYEQWENGETSSRSVYMYLQQLLYDKDDEVLGHIIGNENVFTDLFDQFADGDLSEKGLLQRLDETGLVPSLADQKRMVSNFKRFREMDRYSKLFRDAQSAVSTVTNPINSVTEAFNQYQVLAAIDEETMLRVARVFNASTDLSVRSVGASLESFATASPLQRMIQIRGGAFIAMKLSEAVNKMVVTMVEDIIGAEFMIAVKFSTGFVNTLTGVSALPAARSELQYSSDAARDAYDVFQSNLTAYEAQPTDENFSDAFWSYYTYCQMTAVSLQDLVDLYNVVYDTPTGKLLLKDDQTDTIIARISGMVNYCKMMSQTTYGFYQVWKTGDPLAFAAAVGSSGN